MKTGKIKVGHGYHVYQCDYEWESNNGTRFSPTLTLTSYGKDFCSVSEREFPTRDLSKLETWIKMGMIPFGEFSQWDMDVFAN